jgi:hypothetical protein
VGDDREARPVARHEREHVAGPRAAGARITRRGLHHIKEIEAEWQQRWRAAGYDGTLRHVLEQALEHGEDA